MSKYITIVLKKEHQKYADAYNTILFDYYGASDPELFMTKKIIQEEQDFLNNDEVGLTELPRLQRPVTAKGLSNNLLFYRLWEAHIPLTDENDIKRRNALALFNWLNEDGLKAIDINKSQNYDMDLLEKYVTNENRYEKGKLIYPGWVSPDYLDGRDSFALKHIYELYLSGREEEAFDFAYSNCDTMIREQIPGDIWKALGGELTKTGLQKLKISTRAEKRLLHRN